MYMSEVPENNFGGIVGRVLSTLAAYAPLSTTSLSKRDVSPLDNARQDDGRAGLVYAGQG